MARTIPHRDTLFHLEPMNDFTRGFLSQYGNIRAVSKSARGNLAFEIGYHVTEAARGGQVLARIGRARTADIVLNDKKISGIHIAFEVHPASHAILLCVVARVPLSVGIVPQALRVGDGFHQAVLVPGQKYAITICAYDGSFEFDVVWRPNFVSIPEIVKAGFQEAEARAISTEFARTKVEAENNVVSWYNTMLPTSRLENGVKRIQEQERLGSGAFGDVFKGVDLDSGHLVAMKVVQPRDARSYVNLHREIQALGTLKHPHIVEFLGCGGIPI